MLDACCGTGDLAIGARAPRRRRRRPRLLRARCSSARGARRPRSSGCRATCSRCRSTTRRSTRRPSASACATSRISKRASASCGACSAPGGRLGILEITTPRGRLAPFYRVWFDRVVPLARQGAARRLGLHVPARERAPLPRAGRRSPRCSSANGFADVRYRTFAGGIVALHVGEAGDHRERARGDPRGRRARGVPRRARGAARPQRREPSRASSRPSATRRSPPAASGFARCSSSSRRRRGGSRRSPPASPSSSCTWRRSSTTT